MEDSYKQQKAINVVTQHIPMLVTFEQNVALMSPISLQEVEMVVISMSKNKASGPDGYTSYFFQTCWSFLANEIHELVEESRQTMNLYLSLNVMFLPLYPKWAI